MVSKLIRSYQQRRQITTFVPLLFISKPMALPELLVPNPIFTTLTFYFPMKSCDFLSYFILCFFAFFTCPLKAQEYEYPFTQQRLVTEEDLIEADSWEVMRNEIYARKGYKFSKKQWQDYFADKSWYRPTSSNVKLSDIEQRNVALIKQHEEKGFEGFDAFFNDFKKQVLSKNRAAVRSYFYSEVEDEAVKRFFKDLLEDESTYEMVFESAGNLALFRKATPGSIPLLDKDRVLSAEGCHTFHFTKKMRNGKPTWVLAAIVAAG
jgi:hypothetical protein